MVGGERALAQGQRVRYHRPMTKIDVAPTQRGFMRGSFRDRDGKECLVQESSLAEEPALRLGAKEGTHVDGQCLGTMHLTQEQVAALIPLLQRFVAAGRL